MSFEDFPNELLYDVFEYLSSVDLFRAFNGLNIRFDQLLIEYYQIRQSIDFRLTSKEDLSLIRQRYLPSIVHQINSLCLSDEDTNPHQIDIFLSRLYPLYRFINLQSITFHHIYSIDKVIRILNDLQRIPDLITLNLIECYLEYDLKKLLGIMNSIWSLSNLKHCCLDLIDIQGYNLIPPTMISCSLEDLSIKGIQCGLETLSVLYEHTPHLQSLSIETAENEDDYSSLPIVYSLNQLKLRCQGSSRALLSILRKVPNVTKLTIETNRIEMTGQQWENLLGQYFPVLKILNLKMKYQLMDFDDIEEKIDEILKSYRTSYWIDQHQWFVRCFCTTENHTNLINIHTLPYRFKESTLYITDNENSIFKSTYPDDDHDLIYNYVQNLDCCCNLSEDVQLPQIQFPNLRYLRLSLPHDDYFPLLIPRFDKLISLTIDMFAMGFDQQELQQLQMLLDQSPRLEYLKFNSWSSVLSKGGFKNKKVIKFFSINIFCQSICFRLRIRICLHLLFEVPRFVILIFKEQIILGVVNITMKMIVHR